MKLKDDGDYIKAVGFVAIYSAYLEDSIRELLSLCGNILPVDKVDKIHRYGISDQAKWLRKATAQYYKAIVTYPNSYKDDEAEQVRRTLKEVEDFAKRRNDIVHSAIINDTGTILFKNKSGTKSALATGEIYQLAEDMFNLAGTTKGLRFPLGRLLHACSNPSPAP